MPRDYRRHQPAVQTRVRGTGVQEEPFGTKDVKSASRPRDPTPSSSSRRVAKDPVPQAGGGRRDSVFTRFAQLRCAAPLTLNSAGTAAPWAWLRPVRSSLRAPGGRVQEEACAQLTLRPGCRLSSLPTRKPHCSVCSWHCVRNASQEPGLRGGLWDPGARRRLGSLLRPDSENHQRPEVLAEVGLAGVITSARAPLPEQRAFCRRRALLPRRRIARYRGGTCHPLRRPVCRSLRSRPCARECRI